MPDKEIPPVDRTKQVLTSGEPVPEDRSHTTIDPASGMQKGYIVLTAEERAKGFVRPVRQSYVHRGRVEQIPDPDQSGYSHFGVVHELERRTGCGGTTTMALSLAETYARDPEFYSGTFCANCRVHLPLTEFVWAGTDEQVGS
jgi:hypothetical protein